MMSKTVKTILLIGALSIPTSVLAWSPTRGEEQQLFNQYVTEMLDYKPPKAVYDNLGNFSHWDGPTYEEQWDQEYQRRMREGKNAANTRNNRISNSSREVQRLQQGLQNDSRISDLEQRRRNAQARVNAAERIAPDGPEATAVSQRLNDSRNAGGRLDANRDGKIDDNERKAALSNRVSMQQTQYRNEKKLDRDGNNDISRGETTSGLVQVAGQSSLDHHGLLTNRKQKPNYRETGIGEGTYVDAHGNVGNRQSLNNPNILRGQLAQNNIRRDGFKHSRDNNPMTASRLANGRPLPAQTHRHASITTTGTWGTTRTWNRSFDASGAANRSTAQLQNQMRNPQASGANNQFYNRMQASTSNLRGANTASQTNVNRALATQGQSPGFRNAQSEAQEIYNSLNR